MTARLANNAASKLQNDISAEDTTITIAMDDADLFPSISGGDWFPLTITAMGDNDLYETVHVTARDNNSLTVKRGCENTKAQAFAAGSHVDIRLTAQVIENLSELYYGVRTTPPENAPIGALYLDCSQDPNVTKILTEQGWEPTISTLYGEHALETFVSDGTRGPFKFDGYFNASCLSVDGKMLYQNHGYKIDHNAQTFTLDVAPKPGVLIVFHGYKPSFLDGFVSYDDFYDEFDLMYRELSTVRQSLYDKIDELIESGVSGPGLGGGVIYARSAPKVQPLSATALTDKVISNDSTSIQPTRQDLITKAASLRWQNEFGGITVDGLYIDTDQSSQTMMQGARIAADNNPDFTINWKTPSGFVRLDAQQIKMINTAIIAHISACFACEARLTTEIEEGEITDFEQLETRFKACLEECCHAR